MPSFKQPSDMLLTGCELYFLPVATRVPLKFGGETLTSVTCARVKLTVRDSAGHTAVGWGESPLSVQWGWPSDLLYEQRHQAMRNFCGSLCRELLAAELTGHALEIGADFQATVFAEGGTGSLLPVASTIAGNELPASPSPPLPHLAALLCLAPLDLALHDAYGNLHARDIYKTYRPPYLNRDLDSFIQSKRSLVDSFVKKYVGDELIFPSPRKLRAWHLVGGLDPLDDADLTGIEPRDGYPVTLHEWITADGLTCLKIKLRGNDAAWDYDRLCRVGRIAAERQVQSLSADFNCTVTDPQYVIDILERLRADEPRIFAMLLYVEQPFPYELEQYPIDVRKVAKLKPLFLDESAHDWRQVRAGRELGWTGVALKTCKTQTGALLSLCWAKAHGMALMVQDLTNPMLAQIPHIRLAAHAGTIMGVETNAMQF